MQWASIYRRPSNVGENEAGPAGIIQQGAAAQTGESQRAARRERSVCPSVVGENETEPPASFNRGAAAQTGECDYLTVWVGDNKREPTTPP